MAPNTVSAVASSRRTVHNDHIAATERPDGRREPGPYDRHGVDGRATAERRNIEHHELGGDRRTSTCSARSTTSPRRRTPARQALGVAGQWRNVEWIRSPY
jgi:hypothetical protein